ncbi:MAG: SusD/RagB family nutrient-binding outer membrane lipoprotein [Bacteroidetes bacterium]|nr:SusD/RagB family nutrient-binding outer membrane lipoprotein [Bacteroidota bacterium]MBU1372112.1 SusD/RagB family nutrient-binding outer membrane lipoprotein [Bacteroidota bacterium]MBU1484033.1 SusD/RagB family nutrient-binding outer membrane lipoprotein [Bacteroidota bacterium]MBU1760449.1 SusD/RagB family nutrient-binding outer membrane lipoprotein [Bacteroidota bacterium]MBU2046410.1 SusD/RagB family nutrient-binding outer membrane lipoprotein [Bacteroidota bacterium]
MKRFKIQHLVIMMVLLMTTACTKNFEDLNTDPNRPKQITPGVILGQLQYRLVNTSITQGRSFTHELMQVDAPRSSTNGVGLHRYVVNPGAAVWNSFYDSMTDVQDIYQNSKKLGENNYVAISLIYKSWIYSIMTDLYGDVPYTKATQASTGNIYPAFDAQKDIYTHILSDLDSANNIINTGKALTYGGDLLYNANSVSGGVNVGMVKWKKFCNSLKLRLLLRISKRDGEVNVTNQINAILTDPVKYPVFTSNADEAIFRYPGTFPYYNPYYNQRQLEWRDGTYFTKFFLDKMVQDNDPRKTVWCTTVKVNGVDVYQGIESGYPTTTEYLVGKNTSYNDVMKTMPQLGVMMTYSEMESIKAELALKGFNTGKTPKQHYEEAILASMKQWGVSMPANYLTQSGVAYNPSASTAAQLESIMVQKYYAYFFVDYQSWFEKRRTGYPVLPRGSGIPVENKFPSRVPYPTYLQSLNPENLKKAVTAMGGDNSDIKVWWDK